MTKTEDWQNYLEKLSDIPKQYQKGYKVALSMIDLGKLQEQLLFSDTESAKLLSFFRKVLLSTVMWTEKFSLTAGIPKIELLKEGLEWGLFALKCTGMRNFSWIEQQIKTGIRSLITSQNNYDKHCAVRKKIVSRKPVKCPFCSSQDIKKVIYGLPSPDFDYSKYISGGCVRFPDSPLWQCDNCYVEFIKKPHHRKEANNDSNSPIIRQ